MTDFAFDPKRLDEPGYIEGQIRRDVPQGVREAGGTDQNRLGIFSVSDVLMGVPAQKSQQEAVGETMSKVLFPLMDLAGIVNQTAEVGGVPESLKEFMEDAGVNIDGLFGPSSSQELSGAASELGLTADDFGGQYSNEQAAAIVKVLSLANAEVGYREGSNNDNKFAAIAGVANNNYWCATFLMAMFKQAGEGFEDNLRMMSPGTEYCRTQFMAAGRFGTTPVTGALAFFHVGEPMNRNTNHMGIVVDVIGSEIKTIEGNTSQGSAGNQRDSAFVAIKHRPAAVTNPVAGRFTTVGYGYPIYPEGADIFTSTSSPYSGYQSQGSGDSRTGLSGTYRFHAAQEAESDYGGVRPGAQAFMDVVLSKISGTYSASLYRNTNIDNGDTLSVHAEGRALDIGVPNLSTGDQVFRLIAPLSYQLGIQRIIWNRRVWTSRAPSGTNYTGDDPHTDHLHVELTRAKADSLTESNFEQLLAAETTNVDRRVLED